MRLQVTAALFIPIGTDMISEGNPERKDDIC